MNVNFITLPIFITRGRQGYELGLSYDQPVHNPKR